MMRITFSATSKRGAPNHLIATSEIEGTRLQQCSLFPYRQFEENYMFRGGLLWLIGIPIPVIIILWLLGFLS